MKPSIGRIVHYTITSIEAEQINRRRGDAANSVGTTTGFVLHTGNHAEAGQVYPLIITRVWGDDAAAAVNGQLLLDGNDSLWVTSATEGEGERHYVWPPRVG